MNVRRARPGDAEAIARIWFDAWQRSYKGLVPDAVLEALSVEQRAVYWRSRLRYEDSTLVVGDIDGYCRALRESRDRDAPPRTGEIASLYVHPDRHRQGRGRALLERALADLGGCDAVTLWVFEANATARAFYGAFGFAPEGARQLDPGTGVPEIRMRRELG